MKTKDVAVSNGQKECILCHRSFMPHPKVKERQKVCSRSDCQQLRQKLNHLAWLAKNPVDYQQWYHDYGKSWRQANPDYDKHYRRQKKTNSTKHSSSQTTENGIVTIFEKSFQGTKKEQLTYGKTVSNPERYFAKKEQLTGCFYLLKADNMVLLSLDSTKKEQLGNCFY